MALFPTEITNFKPISELPIEIYTNVLAISNSPYKFFRIIKTKTNGFICSFLFCFLEKLLSIPSYFIPFTNQYFDTCISHKTKEY